MALRAVRAVIAATRTLEGGGFPVRRPFPTSQLPSVDPFLLLDEMGPVQWGPGEAIGAPDHPHRGFETITYILEGEVVHRDSHGNAGHLRPGDVQWMTAGSGLVHSEMPPSEFQQSGGRMHGFQIWLNLPADKKMMAPRYRDVPAGQSPVVFSDDESVRVRVIAGEALGVSAALDTVLPATYLHVTLQPGAVHTQAVDASHNAFAYVFRGTVRLSEGSAQGRDAEEGEIGLFEMEGDCVSFTAGHLGADVLFLAAPPLREPIARYGPFVMNTSEEIKQAMDDYGSGRFGKIPPTAD